jgi:hypothetical protein
MKIRIKGNSIRFRLSKSEVEEFKHEKYVEEFTDFGNSIFCYVLKVVQNQPNLCAFFKDDTMTFGVPAHIAKEWTDTDIVGFQYEFPLQNGSKLFLLLEKDFVCLDNSFEDQSDNYPNPNDKC